MIEPVDRRYHSRLQSQIESARTAGAWMPWAGASMAVLLWGGVGVWLVATLGVNTILTQPPLVLAGASAALFAPGLALICAGVMARESVRSSRANAVVLASTRFLLAPAENSREEVASLAEAIARETEMLNRALTDTRARLDGLKHDIENSVTGALKAAEIVRADSEVLVHKMGSERQSLSQLAENLRNQSESLAKAIPRHAQIMADATRSAQEQVRQADSTLDQRLRDMSETSGHLAQRISQLDTMGAESRKRAQNLASVLMRLDEQLVQSTRMVEAATKAGELASAATRSTAESLRDTVSDALGAAMKATETITARSAQASEDARQSIAALTQAGTQAEATTRAAAHAARAHADETEQRINQLSDTLFRTATRATNAAEEGLERARTRIEKASLLLDRMRSEAEASSSIDDLILEPEYPVEQPRAHGNGHTNGNGHDNPFPLFSARPTAASTPPPAPPAAVYAAAPQPLAPHPGAPPPVSLSTPPPAQAAAKRDEMIFGQHHIPRQPAPSMDDELVLDRPVASHNRAIARDPFFDDDVLNDAPSASWRGLLSGIEDVAPRMHEQSAGSIIDRLDRAGVRLHAVKASDLRRIANAAHQGERQRRRAIRDTAPSEIQRVTRLLESDRDLEHAARTFIAAEEPDALRVLSSAERAREGAAPRLSAFLLLDAALGAQV